MRESRNWATYLLLPTIYLMKDELPVDQREEDYQAVKKLVQGIRMIAGFSATPVDPEKTKAAQANFDDFALYLVKRCGLDCMTYKNHNVSSTRTKYPNNVTNSILITTLSYTNTVSNYCKQY
jgi:hypothetical protein